jgi:uncharacterized membrane protein
MEKGKLGIRLCFYSTLAFVLAFLGYSTLIFLLAGVVLIVEKDEFTTRQVIQAFCLAIVNSLLSSVLGILDFFYRVPNVGTIWSTLVSVLNSVISLVVFIFCILGIVNAAKGQDANIPLASNFANWAYGIIAPKVVQQPVYQQPQYQQPYQPYQQAPVQQPYQQAPQQAYQQAQVQQPYQQAPVQQAPNQTPVSDEPQNPNGPQA